MFCNTELTVPDIFNGNAPMYNVYLVPISQKPSWNIYKHFPVHRSEELSR